MSMTETPLAVVYVGEIEMSTMAVSDFVVLMEVAIDVYLNCTPMRRVA